MRRLLLLNIITIFCLFSSKTVLSQTRLDCDLQDSRCDSNSAAAIASNGHDSLWNRSSLTGDWLGVRSALSDSGIAFDISTTQFYQGVTSGGLEQAFEYGGRNDYFINCDGEKLGLSKGFFINMHAETRYGDSVNSLTGALAPANLPLSFPQADGTVTALSGVKFTQFLSESALVYAGKINTFDDFKQPLTGASGLNGFQNIGVMLPLVATRTIPYSTFGTGLVLLDNLEPILALSVYDTNDNPTSSGFDTFFDNGATVVGQLIRPVSFRDLPGHHSILGAYSSGTYTNLQPSVYLDPIEGIVVANTRKTGSWFVGYAFDQALKVSADDPKRMWGLFGSIGIADENPSPIRWSGNIGISGASPFECRKLDSFGLAYYYMGVSDPLKQLAPNLLPLRDEQGVELYYNAGLSPWFHLTPDLQVIDPFRKNSESSLLFGLRAKIDF